MSLSFLVPNRTVLLISDDALYIYSSGAKKVDLVEVVPWDAQGFVSNVADIIVKDCGKKPVLLLNDMVEQHYRKERIIRSGLNALDRKTILKRRLSMAFGNYSVRAALPLKEKIPKRANQPAADLYIFTAVPDTEQLEKAMAAVEKSLAPIAGLCLLPVESASMLKALSQKKGSKRSSSVWSVFVAQHQSGGLRQIVTKNGELALTRMTPMASSPEDALAWSEEVHKEFKATMSYLSRFGYDSSEGLDVTVVAEQDAADIIEGLIGEETNLEVLTVYDVAMRLGLPVDARYSSHEAEILHVAWAGRQNKLTLPMKAGRVDEVHRPRQVAAIVTVALTLGAAFLGYQLLGGLGTLSGVNADIDDYSKRKQQLDLRYQAEIQRKEAMGFDVRLVQSSLAVYDALEAQNIKPLSLFQAMGRAMGRDMRVDSVVLEPGRPSVVSRFVQGKKTHPLYEVTLKMTYPGTTDIDEGNQEVQSLRNRLAEVLKDNDVEVTKFLKDYEYTQGLVVESGDLEKQDLKQEFVAEIVIHGPAAEDAPSNEAAGWGGP